MTKQPLRIDNITSWESSNPVDGQVPHTEVQVTNTTQSKSSNSMDDQGALHLKKKETLSNHLVQQM